MEHPRKCWGPFGVVVGVEIYSIAGVEWLKTQVWVFILLLVLLMVAYFFFMVREMVPIDITSRISKIVEVNPDIPDVLAVMFGVVDPSFAQEGLPIVAVLVGQATLAAIGSYGD